MAALTSGKTGEGESDDPAIQAGGHVPLALGALLILVMWTWRRGS